MGALKLYELPGKFRLIEAEIDATDGELSPDLEKDLEAIQATLEEKAEAICAKRAEILGEVETLRKEVQRIENLARSRKKKAEWLTSYLKNTLEAMKIKNLKTPRFSVTVCGNAKPSVDFSGDIESLPSEWIVTTKHPDTQKAFEQWDAGEPVPEGFVIKLGTHLLIK